MRHLGLTVKEDFASGETGLILDDIRQIDTFMVTTDGLLVAHDILEHQNGLRSIGSVDDELEALGALWFVRGWTGQLRRDGVGDIYSVEESIGTDILNLAQVYNNGVNFRTPVPNTRASEAEDALQAICESGFDWMQKEFEHYEDDYVNGDRMSHYKRSVIHYLRRGYSKAKKRFGSMSKAHYMFWNIAEAVNPVAKHLEFEGQQFKLSYDANRAYCSEFYPEDLY